MELHQIKEFIQNHLSDGLVVIVGSGLSSAEGIPGMWKLADHLKSTVPTILNGRKDKAWEEVDRLLTAGTDLETALHQVKVGPELETIIVDITAKYLGGYESQIIADVVNNGRVLRFEKLLKHLIKPNTGIPVITTNYDRLIEVAAESAGLGVNTLFCGSYIGRFDPKESRYSLCRGIIKRRKSVHLSYTDSIIVLKPHGSLDWFLKDGDPISSPLADGQRLIITPGINKFRGGYERPFDAHRERANSEIDKAARYLIIGYGFNDDHLQVHLDRQLVSGKPALVLTHGLTEKAEKFVRGNDNIFSIVGLNEGDGFRLIKGKQEFTFKGPNIWDLYVCIKEVLEP